jgi:hypothetical protein
VNEIFVPGKNVASKMDEDFFSFLEGFFSIILLAIRFLFLATVAAS